jgi:hypothetical protein
VIWGGLAAVTWAKDIDVKPAKMHDASLASFGCCSVCQVHTHTHLSLRTFPSVFARESNPPLPAFNSYVHPSSHLSTLGSPLLESARAGGDPPSASRTSFQHLHRENLCPCQLPEHKLGHRKAIKALVQSFRQVRGGRGGSIGQDASLACASG